jgi:hypothetical protein
MSEFLARGWNTCTPDVDVGDDVLVLEDRAGQFKRVQVKTATAIARNKGYGAQFYIPMDQLRQPILPEIHYVLMVRRDYKWVNTLIIRREYLFDIYQSLQTNINQKKSWVLYISFQENEIKCSDIDLSQFVDDFSEFPDILH